MKSMIIGCMLMSIVSAAVLICPDKMTKEEEKVLRDNNREWSEKWCEALIIRNKVLKQKYGDKWYTQEIYKTIPKNERETELLKKLREISK